MKKNKTKWLIEGQQKTTQQGKGNTYKPTSKKKGIAQIFKKKKMESSNH